MFLEYSKCLPPLPESIKSQLTSYHQLLERASKIGYMLRDKAFRGREIDDTTIVATDSQGLYISIRLWDTGAGDDYIELPLELLGVPDNELEAALDNIILCRKRAMEEKQRIDDEAKLKRTTQQQYNEYLWLKALFEPKQPGSTQ